MRNNPDTDSLSFVTIVQFLQKRLSTLTARQRAAIAVELGLSPQLIPKLLCGARDNPRVQTIQPLLDYFAAVDRGDVRLPDEAADPATERAA